MNGTFKSGTTCAYEVYFSNSSIGEQTVNSSQRKYLHEQLAKTHLKLVFKPLALSVSEAAAKSIMDLYHTKNRQACDEYRETRELKRPEFNARKEELKVMILCNTAKFTDVLQAIENLDKEYNA